MPTSSGIAWTLLRVTNPDRTEHQLAEVRAAAPAAAPLHAYSHGPPLGLGAAYIFIVEKQAGDIKSSTPLPSPASVSDATKPVTAGLQRPLDLLTEAAALVHLLVSYCDPFRHT